MANGRLVRSDSLARKGLMTPAMIEVTTPMVAVTVCVPKDEVANWRSAVSNVDQGYRDVQDEVVLWDSE